MNDTERMNQKIKVMWNVEAEPPGKEMDGGQLANSSEAVRHWTKGLTHHLHCFFCDIVTSWQSFGRARLNHRPCRIA